MKPLSDFYPRIGTHVVGCPEPTMAQALVDSAIAFCEESLVQREVLDNLQTAANNNAYELDTPAQQQVARVISVSRDGQILKSIPADMKPAGTSQTGKPAGYYTRRNGSQLELVLVPTPDKRYSLGIEVALRPNRSATQLEDDLYELWVETVVAGAVARITAIPNQPFSDPNKSVAAYASALLGARRARNEGAFGRLRGSITARINPQKFA